VAFSLDGAGHATRVDARGLPDDSLPRAAFRWIHVNGTDPEGTAWLARAGLDEDVVAALVAEETRPRFSVEDNGVLLNLRGVNLNPGAEPEDMISIRLFIEQHRVISVWRRPLYAVQDVFDALARERAPHTPGQLVARISLRLADRAEPTVVALNERIDDLEDRVLTDEEQVSRKELSDIRLTAIILRRYLFPQRDALSTFEIEDLAWLSAADRSDIRESRDRVTRLAEELDAIRDRAQIVHEQILEHRSDVMNRQMLVLTVVAAIFLPLGLLTGLLGINVGGVPGADHPYAFWIVTALLVVLGLGQAWLFRRFLLRRR